jgi:hypothetical protein
MIEAFAQTNAGKSVLSKLGLNNSETTEKKGGHN